jgi:hypothetical protein
MATFAFTKLTVTPYSKYIIVNHFLYFVNFYAK